MSPASTTASRAISSSKSLLDRLIHRKLIGGIYPESPEYRDLVTKMLQKPVTVYAGFDATSNSLHVGNLATIMNLIHFQRNGHNVVCVIGDATTKIGDPSGHTKDRIRINRDIIKTNADHIESTIRNVFNNHEKLFDHDIAKPKKPIIVRNSEWYEGINVVDFVADIFCEFRVGSILHRKSIKDRLQTSEGMNLSEFSYQVFQAYDWLELRKRYDCRLQIGGSDQEGNIYSGHELIKKCLKVNDSIGLLTPLILDSQSGKKLGKSVSKPQSNIWLRKESTSPYNLYQFFHRTPDKDIEKFLKVFSLYGDDVIQDLIYNHLKKPTDVWYCQRKLADHVCLLVHGEEGLKSAKKITHAFFNRNPMDIANLEPDEVDQLFDSDSIINIIHRDGLRVLDLIRRANCFQSELDAERVINAGGLWLNGARVTSINVPIGDNLIIGNGVTIMRIGKKNYYLFRWTN